MKKLFLVALVAMFTSTVSAQLIKSSRVTVTKNHTSKIWLDLGAGAYTGDFDDTGMGVDLGFRWTQMFGESIGWDILKLSAQSDTKNFADLLNVQLKTGLRYVSPVLFGKQSLYANGAVGYGVFTKKIDESDARGIAWEIGAGINITKRFSVGIAYNTQHFKGETWDKETGYEKKGMNAGIISLRLGVGL